MVLSDGELSLRNALSVSQAGLGAIQAGASSVDLSALNVVDSSAVAVMLAWQRSAQALNRQLQFIGAPASLHSLIALYGLTDFFHMVEAHAAERH